jgi:hypothetical protein
MPPFRSLGNSEFHRHALIPLPDSINRSAGSPNPLKAEGTILAHHPDPEEWVGKSLVDVGIPFDVLSRPESSIESSIGGQERMYTFASVRGSQFGIAGSFILISHSVWKSSINASASS